MGKGIPQEGLKAIAALSMLLDHGAAVLGGSPWLRICGRLAFPIYCFLLTEGVKHTGSPKRYLLRLLLLALISEPIYDWVLYPGAAPWLHQNVLWTLALGCGMLLGMSKTSAPEGKLLLVVLFALAAQLMGESYGSNGILTIALFALSAGQTGQTPLRWLALLGINWLMGSMETSVLGWTIPIQPFAVLAMIPISLYSGEKRTASPVLAWGFYLFYPLHLVVLRCIKIFL